jgi:hypothetical protein
MPSMSASATATSGAQNSGDTASPWYQGDMVNVWGDGDIATGSRDQGTPGASLGGLSGTHLLIAGAIIVGALLWKKLSK